MINKLETKIICILSKLEHLITYSEGCVNVSTGDLKDIHTQLILQQNGKTFDDIKDGK